MMIPHQHERLQFISYLVNHDGEEFTISQLRSLFFELVKCEDTFNSLFIRLLKIDFLVPVAFQRFRVQSDKEFFAPSFGELQQRTRIKQHYWSESKTIAERTIKELILN